jgi:hypothetical protein
LDEKKVISVSVGHGEISIHESISPRDLEFEFAKLLYATSPKKDNLTASLDHVSRCQLEGCNNFLVKVHKKEKIYCSNKCAWRAYSKFRREEEKKDRLRRKEKN